MIYSRKALQQGFICLLLAFITLAAFWPVTRHEFINCDDQAYVTENTQVQAGLTWKGLVWAFTTQHSANWHPLTWLSHMLDVQLFGSDAGGHHLTSLLLHIATTVVLFLLLDWTTKERWPSASVALLFGLHPLHVESVAWVAERKDVLSGLFLALTLWAYVRYTALRPTGDGSAKGGAPSQPACGRAGFWYASTLICFALGLMSKPMLVTLPFALLLLDYWPLNRLGPVWPWRPKRGLWMVLWEKVPFFVMSLGSCIVTFIAQKNSESVATLSVLPVDQRVSNAIAVYGLYLKKLLWPVDLVPFYPYSYTKSPEVMLFSAVLLATISWLAWRTRAKRPWIGIGWLWYLGTLIPVIGLVQVGMQSMADRYVYIPSIGIFIAVCWTAADLLRRWSAPPLLSAGLLSAVLAGCFLQTSMQVRRWRNSETLFRYTLAVTPDNALAHQSLGNSLAAQSKYEEATHHFEEAVRIEPGYAEAHSDLGLALVMQRKLDEGVEHYRAALKLRPRYETARFNLGRALAMQGKYAEAAREFEATLEENPASIEARCGLASALAEIGKTDEAVLQFQEVIRHRPDLPEPRWQLGELLLRIGQVEVGTGHLKASVRLKPTGEAYEALAVKMMTLNRPEEAIEYYREAIRLKPDLPVALNNSAWMMATQPDARFRDGKEAVRLAERACELTSFQQPMFIGTLAAAYAEAGRFGDAAKSAKQACDLAKAQGQKELAEFNERLAEAYRQNKTFRDDSRERSSTSDKP